MDWSRGELKSRAKDTLRTSYWKGFLVSLLLAVVSGSLPSCNWRSNHGATGGGSGGSSSFTWNMDGFPDVFNGFGAVIVGILLVVIVIAVLAGIALEIFVLSPLKAGSYHYFKRASQEDVDMGYVGYGFKKGNYLGIVAGMFWRGWLNFWWFVLFIIPGIVKSYSYAMVPYILTDNPGIGRKRAIQLSREMMHGQKWRTFVLDLSFIGWFLLGAIALGVGVLFVLPYYNSTRAELYLALRQMALDEGLSSQEELCIL
ncbi:DUF975 family protein [Paenibacillus whitsoniae]|uniref:DUF975 family protein n=1 Tax=Paenibacillus whitsoniae TaxID=2496558 RepID=UPI0013DFB7FF|nr:DUF975 family protein [Paenibacillus whitsoniae]